MQLNVNEFKSLLQKATWNYLIPNVWINFDEGRTKTKMASSDREAILLIDKENTEIPDLKESDLYFGEPNRDLKPYLDLLEDESEVELNDEKIVITSKTQKMRIFTCEPQFVNTFSANEPNVDFLFTTEMSQMYDCFSKFKKIASKFGKVYFTNKNGYVNLETTDKENPYSNSVSFDFLYSGVDKNFSLAYSFKYINSLFSFIDPNEFQMSLSYLEEQEAGLITVQKKDDSEKYFILSKTTD